MNATMGQAMAPPTNKFHHKSSNMLEYIIREQQKIPIAPTQPMAQLSYPQQQGPFGKPVFGAPQQQTSIFGQPQQTQQPQLSEQQLQTFQKSINQAYQLRGSTLKLKIQENEPKTMTVNQYLNIQADQNKYQQNLSPSEYLKQQFAYLLNNIQYEQTSGSELPQIATHRNTTEQFNSEFQPIGQFNNTKLTSQMLDGFKSKITGFYTQPQDINPHAPRLMRTDYFTMPPLQQLQQMKDKELMAVQDFKISRMTQDGKVLGQIAFRTPVNLLDVNLDNIVHIEHGVCNVYLHDQPAYQLNVPAVITMYQIFPSQFMDPQAFAAKIQLTTHNIGAKLIKYDHIQGEWVFEVSGFMHYGGN